MQDAAAFFSEGLVGEVEFEDWSVEFFAFGEEGCVFIGEGGLDSAGEGKTNFLFQCLNDESLLGVDIWESKMLYPVLMLAREFQQPEPNVPFSPLPGETKVTEMVREPIDKSVDELDIQGLQVVVKATNSSAQRRSNGSGSQFTDLSQHRVVVNHLVLWLREPKQLSKDCINCNILRLPCRSIGLFLYSVIWSCTLDKGISGKVTVNVNEKSCYGETVEVEGIGGIGDGVSENAASNVVWRWNGLDSLGKVDGEKVLWYYRVGGNVRVVVWKVDTGHFLL